MSSPWSHACEAVSVATVVAWALARRRLARAPAGFRALGPGLALLVSMVSGGALGLALALLALGRGEPLTATLCVGAATSAAFCLSPLARMGAKRLRS